jgi:hypothetical protein
MIPLYACPLSVEVASMTTKGCSFLVSNATQLTVGNFNISGENRPSGEVLMTLQGIHINEFVAFDTNKVLLAIKEAVRRKGLARRTVLLVTGELRRDCGGCGGHGGFGEGNWW